MDKETLIKLTHLTYIHKHVSTSIAKEIQGHENATTTTTTMTTITKRQRRKNTTTAKSIV